MLSSPRIRTSKHAAIAVFSLFFAVGGGAQSAPVAWQSQGTLTVHWQGVAVLQAADRLGESQRLYVWLDRRVDPNARVNLSATNAPVSEVLDQLAGSAGAEWTGQGDFIYVGPPQSVRQLRTLLALARERASELPPVVGERLLSKVAINVPRLSQPRQLVQQLATQAKLPIANPEAVPHDVWPARQLPPMSVAEQLAIVLANFDLTWNVAGRGGRQIRIVSIDRPVSIRRLYDRTALSPSALPDLDSLVVSDGPTASQAWVAATVEQHEALGGMQRATARTKPRQQPAGQPREGKRVFSLSVQQQPAGKIVEQLAAQLGKKLDVDRGIHREKLEQRVSFAVDKVELQQLLEAICEPAGLTVQVEGDTIRLKMVADQAVP